MKKKIKIILFLDYNLGYRISKFLKKKNEKIVGLVFDNKVKNFFNKSIHTKIKKLFKIPKKNIFDWSNLKKKKHIDKLKKINLLDNYKAMDLINLLRAKTYSPYDGVYFLHKNRKVEIGVHLRYLN